VPIETVLRQLVVWQWLLATLSILVFQLEVDRLPFLLREYAALEAAREPSAADEMRRRIEETLGWAVSVPEYGEKAVLA